MSNARGFIQSELITIEQALEKVKSNDSIVSAT